MTAVLYAIPASHPCAVVERALQLKAIPYRRVELIPVLHRPVQRLRFPAGSVPGIRFADGKRLSGSRTILRALEALAPAPPLLPADGEARAVVERAEEWGDQVLQPLARRVTWAAIRREPATIMSYTEGARLPVPRWGARASAPLVAWMAARLSGAADPVVRADLSSLPGHLDRVDKWIAGGVLGGDALNVADLQIASSLALLRTIGDVAPVVDARPAGEQARRVFPEYPGAVPLGTLPAGWLPAG